jgi:hypothetical protein
MAQGAGPWTAIGFAKQCACQRFIRDIGRRARWFAWRRPGRKINNKGRIGLLEVRRCARLSLLKLKQSRFTCSSDGFVSRVDHLAVAARPKRSIHSMIRRRIPAACRPMRWLRRIGEGPCSGSSLSIWSLLIAKFCKQHQQLRREPNRDMRLKVDGAPQ